MELFSLKSIDLAKKIGLGIIVDINVLKNLKDPIKFMNENKLEYVSISQTHKNKLIKNYANKVRNIFFKSLEKKLLDNKVKFYVYGLNDKKNVTEYDIVCKYNDIFYGMYADRWDFNNDIKCF